MRLCASGFCVCHRGLLLYIHSTTLFSPFQILGRRRGIVRSSRPSACGPNFHVSCSQNARLYCYLGIDTNNGGHDYQRGCNSNHSMTLAHRHSFHHLLPFHAIEHVSRLPVRLPSHTEYLLLTPRLAADAPRLDAPALCLPAVIKNSPTRTPCLPRKAALA